MKEYIDIILENYPEKNEEWAYSQLIRCTDNVDVEINHRVMSEILRLEFAISQSELG